MRYLANVGTLLLAPFVCGQVPPSPAPPPPPPSRIQEQTLGWILVFGSVIAIIPLTLFVYSILRRPPSSPPPQEPFTEEEKQKADVIRIDTVDFKPLKF